MFSPDSSINSMFNSYLEPFSQNNMLGGSLSGNPFSFIKEGFHASEHNYPEIITTVAEESKVTAPTSNLSNHNLSNANLTGINIYYVYGFSSDVDPTGYDMFDTNNTIISIIKTPDRPQAATWYPTNMYIIVLTNAVSYNAAKNITKSGSWLRPGRRRPVISITPKPIYTFKDVGITYQGSVSSDLLQFAYVNWTNKILRVTQYNETYVIILDAVLADTANCTFSYNADITGVIAKTVTIQDNTYAVKQTLASMGDLTAISTATEWRVDDTNIIKAATSNISTPFFYFINLTSSLSGNNPHNINNHAQHLYTARGGTLGQAYIDKYEADIYNPSVRNANTYIEKRADAYNQYFTVNQQMANLIQRWNNSPNYDAIDHAGNLYYNYDENNPSPRLQDAMLSDTKQSLVQYNSMYILGTVAATAFIVVGIAVAST